MIELIFAFSVVIFSMCSHVKARTRLKGFITLILELTRSKMELVILRTQVYLYQTSLNWTEEQFIEAVILKRYPRKTGLSLKKQTTREKSRGEGVDIYKVN